jgi:formylglycine-generating enzyme required for sulfatase activity
MKSKIVLLFLTVCIIALIFSCDNTMNTDTGDTDDTEETPEETAEDDSSDDGGSDDDGGGSFDNATTPGQAVSITVGSETIDLIYANNQTNITFPFSPTEETPVDDNPATLTRKFFMSETQVTNALMAEVLQWAYDNGKFSDTVSDHNGLDSTTVKYCGQQLFDLTDTDIKINYSGGSFTVDSGYEDYPVVCVWYGAIMFCNWLSELHDGNDANVVYGWVDNGDGGGIDSDGIWQAGETDADTTLNGYRLPSSEEWEYAARYIGTIAPTQGNLPAEYVAQGVRGGDATLTAGYYWAPADYVSGAIRDYNNETETRAVAWYSGDPGMGGSNKLMPVALKSANQLGLHDMSGNMWEWCFTASGLNRVMRGGCWHDSADSLQVGSWSFGFPGGVLGDISFRFARTQPDGGSGPGTGIWGTSTYGNAKFGA